MVFLPAGAASPGVSPGTCRQKPVRDQRDVREQSDIRALTTGTSPLDMLSSNSASRSCRRRRRTVSKTGTRQRPFRPRTRPPHHLPLLLQDDGLPGSLPQSQGLVVRRRHQVVPVGADGQTPNLPMMTLRGRFSLVSGAGWREGGNFLSGFSSNLDPRGFFLTFPFHRQDLSTLI